MTHVSITDGQHPAGMFMYAINSRLICFVINKPLNPHVSFQVAEFHLRPNLTLFGGLRCHISPKPSHNSMWYLSKVKNDNYHLPTELLVFFSHQCAAESVQAVHQLLVHH